MLIRFIKKIRQRTNKQTRNVGVTPAKTDTSWRLTVTVIVTL